MRWSRALGSWVVVAAFAPAAAIAQPIVQPAPPIVQPAPYAPQPTPAPAPDPAAPTRSTLMTGVVLTAITQGAAWTLATVLGPFDRQGWWLALPVAGPAVWGALWGCEVEEKDACRALVATGGGFWSALQLGGALALFTGLAERPKSAGPRVAVGPLAIHDARGLALFGAF